MSPTNSRRTSVAILALLAIGTAIAWQFPLGRQILYPFTWLATFAHEMGHGLTAFALGADFLQLEMHPDGSGVAQWKGDVGRVGQALVAAGGLVGPTLAGVLLLILSTWKKAARWALGGVGVLAVVSLFWVARSWFAVVFILSLAVLLLGLVRFAPKSNPFVLQLLAVQLCMSVFRDVRYMFSQGGQVGGEHRLSDSAVIEQALFLPYWFWGGLTALFSFAVLILGLKLVLRRGKTKEVLTH